MIQPLGPRLLVKRLDAPKPSTTIIIPDSVADKPSVYALVLAVGNKLTEQIEIGDTVILKDFAGAAITTEFDGEMMECAMVVESDVLAIVEGM